VDTVVKDEWGEGVKVKEKAAGRKACDRLMLAGDEEK
jgi:hypothetical protein